MTAILQQRIILLSYRVQHALLTRCYGHSGISDYLTFSQNTADLEHEPLLSTSPHHMLAICKGGNSFLHTLTGQYYAHHAPSADDLATAFACQMLTNNSDVLVVFPTTIWVLRLPEPDTLSIASVDRIVNSFRHWTGTDQFAQVTGGEWEPHWLAALARQGISGRMYRPVPTNIPVRVYA